MLYLIGGAARAGKTIIAHRFLREKQIPYFCLDYFVSALHRGLPEIGVFHDLPNLIRAQKLWPGLEHLLRNIVEVEPRYLVEGDTFLPGHISELKRTYDPEIRACFLGYTSMTAEKKLKDIRKFRGGVNDWIQNEPDDYILDLAKEMIEFSRFIEEECRKYQIAWFDTSNDFPGAIAKAYDYLSRQ